MLQKYYRAFNIVKLLAAGVHILRMLQHDLRLSTVS